MFELTLFCDLETAGSDHSIVSPDALNVPLLGAVSLQLTANFFTLGSLGLGSTTAYRVFPPEMDWMSWPLVILNWAALAGEPRTAGEAVDGVEEARYLWKLGST